MPPQFFHLIVGETWGKVGWNPETKRSGAKKGLTVFKELFIVNAHEAAMQYNRVCPGG